ncbi:MAG: 50S ribosomal protein L29 [Candidatus Firestonebacteria bacterium]
MKAKEIRDLTVEEIKNKLQDSKKQLFNLRLKLKMKQLDNPSQIRFLRRDIARVNTILKEKAK